MLDLKGRESDSSKISINYYNEISISSLSIDIFYKPEPFGIGIIIGPTFDFNINQNLKESLSLIDPDQTIKFKKQDGIILDETGRSGTYFNNQIPDYNNFQLKFNIGFQTSSYISRLMILSSSILYGLNITSILKNANTDLMYIKIGFSLQFVIWY
jgi:hypothetical protein